MFIINRKENRVAPIEEKSFHDLHFKERDHLQEWIVHNPEFFGEELLFIQKEFDGFENTRERLDLLALDKAGNIVVIENKLDDSGRDVTWQVLKYASYCSSLSKHHIRNIYQQYLDKYEKGNDAGVQIAEFLGVNDFEEAELNKSQRMILVAAKFRKEVTSTVLWLLNNYRLKIQCFKVTPFEHNGELILNIEKIIPVKEVEEFIISVAEKNLEESDTQEKVKTWHATRIAYWNKLLEAYNKTASKTFQNISPTKDNWLMGGVGLGGVGVVFCVTGKSARVEFNISRPSQEENKFIFDLLLKKKEIIESDFGGRLSWERNDNLKFSKIKDEILDVNVFERSDWDKMIKYHVDAMLRLENAIKKHIKGIKQHISKLNA